MLWRTPYATRSTAQNSGRDLATCTIRTKLRSLLSKIRFRFRRADADVWTIVDNIEWDSATLEVTISGLDDLCSSYEIAIYLDGAPGTNGTLVKLVDVLRPHTEELKNSFERSTIVKKDILQPPGELRIQGE